jgi:hypothetical protein
MSYGKIAIAEQTGLASASAKNFTPSDFTLSDGTAVTSSDALFVRSIMHEDDVTINRTGDPNADGTFEINEQIISRSGEGEIHSATNPITSDAGIEVLNDGSVAQGIVVIAEYADAANVFVEQVESLADAAELTRTTASRGSDETILELVIGGAPAEVERKYDPDDDGTFEIKPYVSVYSSPTVVTETLLHSVDVAGRTNPAFENAIVNESGSPADFMIIGTITSQ